MGQEALDRRMVDYVLVPIRDHGPPPVPPSLADDVDRGSHEGVRIPNHGANVRVMLPVFDCHVEGMAAFIEVGNDRMVAPVAVSIDHIAPVSRGQQVRVEVWIVGPWSGVRANTYVSGGTIGSRHPAMVSALACPGAVAVARQGDSTVHVGVNFFPTAEAIDPIRLGEELEQRSFESMWLAEHSHIPTSRTTPWGGRVNAPPLPDYYARTCDSMVVLSAVAARTDSLKLATGISLVAQHDPIWLAKQVASLDIISRGRLLFGIGYGWNKEEMAQHGVSYATRRQLVEEKIGLMKALWTEDETAYEGQLVRLEPSWSWPKPYQKPHPPIVMGGSAGPKIFAAIARFCDGWMPIISRTDIESSLSLLNDALAAVGRSPESIELSAHAAPADPEQWARWEAMGFSRAVIHVPSAPANVVLPLLHEYATLIEG